MLISARFLATAPLVEDQTLVPKKSTAVESRSEITVAAVEMLIA